MITIVSRLHAYKFFVCCLTISIMKSVLKNFVYHLQLCHIFFILYNIYPLYRSLPEHWAFNVRRHIDDSLKINGRPSCEDVINLQKKFIRVVINALQPDASNKVKS